MQRLVAPGLLLLALVLVLNLQAGVYDRLFPRSEPETRTISTGTSVRIFSCGGGLAPERFDRRLQAQAIVVDGHLYAYDTSKNGLRVATFFAGDDEVRFENYDLGRSDEDVAAFVELVRSAPVDAVMAMAVFRFIDPRGEGREGRAEALREVFEEIGARSAPETVKDSSWAYLCVRRPQGWVALSEALSTTKGIMLAYQLSPDPAAVDRARPELLVDGSARERIVELYPMGAYQVGPFSVSRRGYDAAYEVNLVKRDGISASPPYGPKAEELGTFTNRIVLPYVKLGPRASFEAQLGVESYFRPKLKGVEFQVVVDGEVVDRCRLGEDPDEPDAWVPWTVDLSAWENRWVSFEMRTARVDLEPGEVPQWPLPAIWGDPTLVCYPGEGGGEASKRDRLLSVLDRNRDSVLEREEVVQRLGLLDKDGDGVVTGEELPKEFSRLMEVLDVDGDGVAKREEIEGFYDRLGEVVPGER